MADTFKHLAQGKVVHTGNAAAQELYEVPSGTTTIVGHMRIVNNHSGALTFTLSQNGIASADNAYIILPALTIEAGGWAEFTGSIIMDTGDKLYGLCSGSASTLISYNIYGLEVT
jgi:hypothetical protein